jgi:alpha-glucosidase
MWDQDGVHEIYRRWREIVDTYTPPRILVAEAWCDTLDRLAAYLRPDEMHQAFNFAFLGTAWSASALRAVIDESLAANAQVRATTTWVWSTHDTIRHASRLGLDPPNTQRNGIGARDPQPDAAAGLRRARAATLLMLALPGSAYLYQGEELGLPDHTCLPDGVRTDPSHRITGGREAGRDGARIPFPWAGTAPALGFSPTGRVWLPQPDLYRELAADRQAGVAGSTLELYRSALRIRRERGLGRGTLTWLDFDQPGVRLDADQADIGHDPRDPEVLALRNGNVVVLLNLGTAAYPLPPGEVLLTSDSLRTADPLRIADRAIPPDTTAWLDVRPGSRP